MNDTIGLDVVIANQEGELFVLRNATRKELSHYKTEHSIILDFSDRYGRDSREAEPGCRAMPGYLRIGWNESMPTPVGT